LNMWSFGLCGYGRRRESTASLHFPVHCQKDCVHRMMACGNNWNPMCALNCAASNEQTSV